MKFKGININVIKKKKSLNFYYCKKIHKYKSNNNTHVFIDA